MILKRILCFPFVAAIVIINNIGVTFWQMYNYLRYGGQTIGYGPDHARHISELYDKLCEIKEGKTIIIEKINEIPQRDH